MTLDELLTRLDEGGSPQERGSRFELVAAHWLAGEAGPGEPESDDARCTLQGIAQVGGH